LHESLSQEDVDSLVFADRADGHWLTFPARAYRPLVRRLERTQPDIVHGHFSLPSALPLTAASDADTPLVITVMGADVHDPTRFDLLRPLATRANAHLFDRADAVVTPSSDMQHRVREQFDVTPRLIHHGIDPSRWRYRDREAADPPALLTVARLVSRKQLGLAIDAVAALRDHHDIEATYTIVGDGPLRSRLAARAAEHDWLTVAGYVDDLQRVYDAHDLFVLPSKHEAFGMVFLEALACGLPCVTTPTGGQTDIVTSDVGAVAQADARPLARALRDVHDDYDARQRATRDRVENAFTATQMAADYAALYREVAR
jgi:glycosyltransferase involved in cell wall biosynthesis